MRHLNYNHLLYFWTVAREGSITRASEVLHITPQTISGQIKLLESAVGAALFKRVGRGIELTQRGQQVMPYADEIFSVGRELAESVRNPTSERPRHLNVGVVDSIPKLIGYRLLEPALEQSGDARISCNEGDLERLVADLALNRLDLVISDRPVPARLNVKLYGHPLGSSAISFFADVDVADAYAAGFPGSMDAAPVLLPMPPSGLRSDLDAWFSREGIMPQVVAEFGDSALMKVFGASGRGVFPAPDVIAEEVERMYKVKKVGRVEKVSETYYAISAERKLKHPLVISVIDAARENLFGVAAEPAIDAQ